MPDSLPTVQSIAYIGGVAFARRTGSTSAGYRKLPVRITERVGAHLIAEALADENLAPKPSKGDPASLSPLKRAALYALLRQKPTSGGPAIDWAAPPLGLEDMQSWVPPWIPDVKDVRRSVIRTARPADHAGAICGPDGLPIHEPDGSIGYYVAQLKGLCLRAEIGEPSWATPDGGENTLPAQRPEGRRTGRPTVLDRGAILRALLGLIEASRPGTICVSDAPCLALVLWLSRLLVPDPGPPSGEEHPYEFFNRPEPKPPLLPVLEEVEPHVVTGGAVAEVAKALRDLARCRNEAM